MSFDRDADVRTTDLTPPRFGDQSFGKVAAINTAQMIGDAMSEDKKDESIGEEELEDLEEQADGKYAPNAPAGRSSNDQSPRSTDESAEQPSGS